VAAFVACEVGFRWTFGLTRSQVRLVAAAVALATIPLGTKVCVLAQIGALTAMIVIALTAEGWIGQRAGPGSGTAS
jgi:hypothetical protein